MKSFYSYLPELLSLLTRHGFWWFKKNAIQMSHYKIPVRRKASTSVRNTCTVASVCEESKFRWMVPEPLPWIKLSPVIFNGTTQSCPPYLAISPPNSTILDADSQFPLARVHQGLHSQSDAQLPAQWMLIHLLWFLILHGESSTLLFKFTSVKLHALKICHCTFTCKLHSQVWVQLIWPPHKNLCWLLICNQFAMGYLRCQELSSPTTWLTGLWMQPHAPLPL